MKIPIQRDKNGNDLVKPVTKWSIHFAKRNVTLLTVEYLEVQEGVNRAYKHTIQLGLTREMCRELGEGLLKMANGTWRNLPPGTQLLQSRKS